MARMSSLDALLNEELMSWLESALVGRGNNIFTLFQMKSRGYSGAGKRGKKEGLRFSP